MPTRAVGCPNGYVLFALVVGFGEYREEMRVCEREGGDLQVTYQKAFPREFKKRLHVLFCLFICLLFWPCKDI